MNSSSANETFDCIVLGAGIAGLVAARELGRARRHVLLLEARGRLGGRMHTQYVAAPDGCRWPVELGAEFVHGRPPELLDLIETAGLHLIEVEGETRCYDGSVLGPCPETRSFWPLLESLAADAVRGDMSFAAWLRTTDADEGAKSGARGYVEGFNAADANEIGIVGLARQQSAEDAIEGERAARLAQGYSALVAHLAAQIEELGIAVRCDSPATAVHWRPGECRVTAGERVYAAPQLLCAVPLGVLQAGVPRFQPEPEVALRAARSLSAGLVQRAVFRFAGDVWKLAKGGSWLFAPGMPLPVWWSTSAPGSGMAAAWAGGPRSRALPDAEALRAQAMETLRHIFGQSLDGEPAGMWTHDWLRDPWTRGAYSSAPAGAAEAPSLLARPVEHTLFFAGEHTDITGHPGTVHGAMRSGLRAAAQMLGLS